MAADTTPGKRSIKRVLIANRGEIAVRIIRTCKDRGIETVAVFSDADRLAPHVLFADRAIGLGPAPASQSYLVIDKLIAACRDSGADAVHPGYGFLSENDEFVAACEAADITFIGPPASAMRTMGEKTRARAAMQAASVPVVPGNNGPKGNGFPDAASATEAALRIGFPVLIKASAGGGGKGMRLVREQADFALAFDSARREARGAFGDDTVYLEKAIMQPRHVEIQVFADSHGNAVHLGERDCSIQRRHQKVVEEAPSPAVDDDLRRRMGAAAVEAARACDYVGAGTVEFLLAPDGSFFFLEMNTRLQVEHPVTEQIYDVDLVDWQLRVAEGERLPMTQEEIDARRRGAAVECRIYAEDPVRFLPSPGHISHMREPAGPGVRNDAGVYEGCDITTHYDPMISKLITWGTDRAQALARMRRALDEYAIRGIQTNLLFHRRILSHPAFVAGDYDTGFIGREEEAILDIARRDSADDLDASLIATAVEKSSQGRRVAVATPENGAPVSGISAWRTGRRGWRR